MHDIPLLIVALMVFGGLFAFTWSLDSRTKRIENELRTELDQMSEDEKV